ncbi:MAG: hypothetical protein J6R18_04005 [Kiritimatiellae bacterium]|nr:hypothetical protein [Kiritimatiellia bacterium]
MKSRVIWFSGFTAFFSAVMAYVFWGTWSPDVTFIQPDCPILHHKDFFAVKWSQFCSGGAFVPWDLRSLLGGPYVWQELQYAFGMYFATLGVVYYLRGRGLSFLACYGAGAAYGLMGYNITLFSAGHLGWFELLTCAPFCFGLIDRCVKKGKWQNWALLGGLLAWGGVNQPDIWLLFTLFSFAYGLFRLAQLLVSCNGSASRARALLRVLRGVALTAIVLVAAGWPQLYNAAFVHTANRDRQIQESIGPGAQASAISGKNAAAEKEKRYVFCTNWSLPPDEVLEFLVPNVKGASSDARVSPQNRYHGRIGMQVSPGKWAPYRQHSMYMGFLTVCFALLGIVSAFKGKKAGCAASDSNGCNRPEVLFWTISAAVLLLLAFGAFTPFYRLAYSLPMGDYIRCPVKFVHLVEWCVAVLAGFGMALALSSDIAKKTPRIAVAGVAVLSIINALNLASQDARYCAVDPSDTVRIAVSRETGSLSTAFVMDANSQWGEEEYLIAGGTAFRDNARLKDAMAKKSYAPESFWNFRGGRFVKTVRERAGFALLKNKAVPQRPSKVFMPGPSAMISLLGTLCVFVSAILKVCRVGQLGRFADKS